MSNHERRRATCPVCALRLPASFMIGISDTHARRCPSCGSRLIAPQSLRLSFWSPIILAVLAAILVIITGWLGLVLVLMAIVMYVRHAARLIVDVVQPKCPACGYDLRGSADSSACPECGRAL
jgi:hypothetical protein